jgi:4-aminobutyrate aminotransferase-like enzyme
MKDDVIDKAKRLLTPALVFHTDIIVKKAQGLIVEALDGKEYMDFTSGLATTNIGHCPPAVIEAAKRQLETSATAHRLLLRPQKGSSKDSYTQAASFITTPQSNSQRGWPE